MAKRKAGVNDIIYELNNEDLSLSSDDEHDSKIRKTKKNLTNETSEDTLHLYDSFKEKPNIKLGVDKTYENEINIMSHIGGKTTDDLTSTERITHQCIDRINAFEYVNNRNMLNEDTKIDSPASSSDLSAIPCVNRTPLISVRFRDKKIAKRYKIAVKKFLLDLIKHHESFNSVIDSDTDVELEIRPEKFEDEEVVKKSPSPAFNDTLFFVDTDPGNINDDIPMYEQVSQLIVNTSEHKKSESQVAYSRYRCFNCDGDHQLKDCREPRNHGKIAENRRNVGVKPGRYHVEDDQKYGHLIPGRISGQLRTALGLKRYELPLHIYRMRILGYPCGWMEEAKILPSGINLFDSTGTRILDPNEEEGEVFETGSKDLYDIKKILDFPGFNVPASSRYKEESYLYGLPPMSEQDSKILMLQRLAPNAMKAYKRKKLTLFPSSIINSQEAQTEMELDSGEEISEFPSIPPLPDEEPPKLPSPPPPPPETPPLPKSPHPDLSKTPETRVIQDIQKCRKTDSDIKSLDDIEIIEVIKVPDIPVPQDDYIKIDDDDEISSSSSCNSPTIDDLEAKKQELLDAIKFSEIPTDLCTELSKKILSEEKSQDIKDVGNGVRSIDESTMLPCQKIENIETEILTINDGTMNEDSTSITSGLVAETNASNIGTSDVKTGNVKNTCFGTPVMNIVSPFKKVPSDDKFAKDICDIINYENLPNSIGKYKKISSLLKKVKNEVERIQES